MQTIRKKLIETNNDIRDLTLPMPPEGFCCICGKKDEKCLCEKFNCSCDIVALECRWPACVCEKCLEVVCICEM